MDEINKLKRTGTFYRRRNKMVKEWRGSTVDTEISASSSAPSIPPMNDLDPANVPVTNYDTFLEEEHSSADEEEYEMQLLPDGLQGKSFAKCLRYWALKTGQTHLAVNMLLQILRTKTSAENIPRSARTLLKTSRTASSTIVPVEGGEFWYGGINNCLQHVLGLHEKRSLECVRPCITAERLNRVVSFPVYCVHLDPRQAYEAEKIP
uniref:Uncharacterized protein n=1 Tax=Anopheles atroparvus TaxID=41427 RepID=A0AAG5DP61_ANOAO